MNKDEILIIRPSYPVKAKTMNDLHKLLIEQAKTGVVLVPFGYEVVIAPKDVEVKMENKVRKTCGECKYISLGDDLCRNSMSPRSGTNKTTPACGCFERREDWTCMKPDEQDKHEYAKPLRSLYT